MASERTVLAIATFASRARDLTAKVEQAHDLGIPSGSCREPWTVEYLRSSMPILVKTLPRPYLEKIHDAAHVCHMAMSLRSVSSEVREDWAVMVANFESINVVFEEYLGASAPERSPTELNPITPISPGVIRYDELAPLIHPAGAARLQAAALTVERHCLVLASGGVTSEEIEWLRAMARGERNLDIATRYGYSERAFYRALRRLWGKLGVSGRGQALAVIGERGLLEPAIRATDVA